MYEHILKIFFSICWKMSQKCERISYEIVVCDLFVISGFLVLNGPPRPNARRQCQSSLLGENICKIIFFKLFLLFIWKNKQKKGTTIITSCSIRRAGRRCEFYSVVIRPLLYLYINIFLDIYLLMCLGDIAQVLRFDTRLWLYVLCVSRAPTGISAVLLHRPSARTSLRSEHCGPRQCGRSGSRRRSCRRSRW